MGSFTYELHLHSCLSPCGDADMTPSSIAGMAMLNGVKIAALTDHNTCKNCPAFFTACYNYGIVPIAGMELTTVEEIHMVCLFETLDAAMEFDSFVEEHRMKIKNRPDIFGEQLIMNEDDEIIGTVGELLILATDLDITSAANIVRERGGVAFPAHIDKQSNGLIGILGSFPTEPGFASAEFHDRRKINQYKGIYPELEDLIVVVNSDAHALDQMALEPPSLDIAENSDDADCVRRALISLLRGDNVKK